jgi:hypothetical protein
MNDILMSKVRCIENFLGHIDTIELDIVFFDVSEEVGQLHGMPECAGILICFRIIYSDYLVHH